MRIKTKCYPSVFLFPTLLQTTHSTTNIHRELLEVQLLFHMSTNQLSLKRQTRLPFGQLLQFMPCSLIQSTTFIEQPQYVSQLLHRIQSNKHIPTFELTACLRLWPFKQNLSNFLYSSLSIPLSRSPSTHTFCHTQVLHHSIQVLMRCHYSRGLEFTCK